METPIIHPEFNQNINVNLCCGNCLYKVIYSYLKRCVMGGNTYYQNSVTHITCLVDQAPCDITQSNQFEACMTCHMHELGTSLGGTMIECPKDIETLNQNAKLKILLNLRPDIIARFKSSDLIEKHETKEYNKWNKP